LVEQRKWGFAQAIEALDRFEECRLSPAVGPAMGLSHRRYANQVVHPLAAKLNAATRAVPVDVKTGMAAMILEPSDD